jgi:O-antigen/teichoic acid export membrane protein
VWVGVGVALVEVGWGIRGIIYGFMSGFAVLGVWAFARVETPFGRPSIDRVDAILSFSVYDFVSNAGDYAYNWVDVGIIGIYLTQSAVGTYEYAWQVTLPVAIVLEVIAKSLFPQVSRWHASQSTDDIAQVAKIAIGTGLFLSIPAFFGAILFSESILLVLFGPAYVAGATVLPILMAEKIVRSVQVVLSTVLRGVDRPEQSALATGTTVVVNVLLNLLLIPTIGIRGAAFATLGAVCLNAGLHWYLLRSHHRIQFPTGLAVRIAGASTVMALILIPGRWVFEVNSAPELLAVVVGGVVSYSALTALVPSLRQSFVRPGLRFVLEYVRVNRR